MSSESVESVTFDRFEKSPRVTQMKLCESLTVIKNVKREILFERDEPDVIKNTFALRYVCLSYIFFSINKIDWTLSSLI